MPLPSPASSVLHIYGGGLVYLTRCLKQAIANGEGYGNHTVNEPEDNPDAVLVSWKLACIPLLAVLVINFLITEIVIWHPGILEPFQSMKGVPLVVAQVKKCCQHLVLDHCPGRRDFLSPHHR